ncbi:hypothetical protein PULV_a2859 [Pseudoalteromonas ulvae UL12]|nr:hypothetical protein [Pseudoalteromonas ulvae UL12]
MIEHLESSLVRLFYSKIEHLFNLINLTLEEEKHLMSKPYNTLM